MQIILILTFIVSSYSGNIKLSKEKLISKYSTHLNSPVYLNKLTDIYLREKKGKKTKESYKKSLELKLENYDCFWYENSNEQLKKINTMQNSNSTIKPGFWQSTGKNPFWINIIDNQVFWLGMNQNSDNANLGENWCHVGHGKIKDNKIELTWADIPVGKDQLYGKIIIEIIDETHMKVIEDSGNFGKSEWVWVSGNMSFSELKRK
ncbi:hypothetical protein [Tenacibaculum sp.]|uniref:hypothetical protein n=1 Tax=Tenacibaculum sp. TaxID=1906242 RepID=UPI003D0E3B1E